MIIPSKFNGFHGGVRRCFGGGGGGGGGYTAPANTNGFTPSNFDSSAYLKANPDVSKEINNGTANFGDAYGHYARYGMNEGRQGFDVNNPAPPPNAWDKSAVNTQQGYNTLQGMKGVPWEQAGGGYNSLLNQGFTSNQIRDASTEMYGKPSDANWSSMVQNAGMNSPTGRPLPGSDQFYQPIYKPQYQNYNTGNSMNVSQYGQQPFTPQRSAPFNPYTNSSGGGGGFGGGYGGGYGGFMPQMQSPFGYGSQQQSQQQPPPLTSSMQGQPQPTQEMMSNFQNAPQASSNQPAPQQSYSGQEAINVGLGGSGSGGMLGGGSGGFMPQMQNPYARQLPQYVYDTNRNLDQYQARPVQNSFMEQQRQYAQPGQDYRSVMQQQMQPPMQQAQPNYGPAQSIYSRSTQGRGTPNVRRYEEGGIASLMDDVE